MFIHLFSKFSWFLVPSFSTITSLRVDVWETQTSTGHAKKSWRAFGGLNTPKCSLYHMLQEKYLHFPRGPRLPTPRNPRKSSIVHSAIFSDFWTRPHLSPRRSPNSGSNEIPKIPPCSLESGDSEYLPFRPPLAPRCGTKHQKPTQIQKFKTKRFYNSSVWAPKRLRNQPPFEHELGPYMV